MSGSMDTARRMCSRAVIRLPAPSLAKGTEVVPLAVPGGRSVQGVEGFLIAAILDVPVGGLSLGRVELRLLLALLPPPLAKDVLVGVTAIACAAGVGSAAVAGSAGWGGFLICS